MSGSKISIHDPVSVEMVTREYRRYSNTPEERERLSRRACPICGCERSDFNPGNMNTICCRPSCSAEYWGEQRPTVTEMRHLIHDEQEGMCAHCKKEIREFDAARCLHIYHRYILDHIRPIAMGGDQWARENLQVLCVRCNRTKTARDMGNIPRWKKYYRKGPACQEDNFRQARLF